MIDLQTVDAQLKAVGYNYHFFGRPEIIELAKVLMPDETIAQAVNGSYEGGFALLCVTDQRLLLIDKKPFFLTFEDIRYDMIAEIDYNYRLLNGSVRIFTPNKELSFSSWNQSQLRCLIEYLQSRVMEIRQHNHSVMQQPILQTSYGPEQQFQPIRSVLASQQTDDVIPSLGRTAFRDTPVVRGFSFGSSPSGRMVTPPHTLNPYAKQPLPLSRRRTYPVYY